MKLGLPQQGFRTVACGPSDAASSLLCSRVFIILAARLVSAAASVAPTRHLSFLSSPSHMLLIAHAV